VVGGYVSVEVELEVVLLGRYVDVDVPYVDSELSGGAVDDVPGGW